MDENQFDEPVAAHYDDDVADRSTPEELEPMLDVLVALAAPGGRALELAIGTGRVALPLAHRGIDVEGIELSEAMVDRLRDKPGGDAIRVVIGDMATARADGVFDLVFLVFNTIMNLTTQEAQVACFRNAAAHLRPGGTFVVEVIVPQLRAVPPGQTLQPFDVSADHIGVDEYDAATQQAVSHHVTRRGDTWERTSMPFRYVWPAELDLMAQLAGMVRRERWSSWHRDPFTHESTAHVSVWERT